MSVLRDLAAFVCGASVTSLPEVERAIQRRHAADTLLAAAVGAWTGEGRELRYVMSASSLADAIGMQAAVVRHTEIDDIHTPSCTTPSSVTVPTAFALAHAAEISDPAQVASALWVGTELLVRLGVAIDGARVLYRGIWPRPHRPRARASAAIPTCSTGHGCATRTASTPIPKRSPPISGAAASMRSSASSRSARPSRRSPQPKR